MRRLKLFLIKDLFKRVTTVNLKRYTVKHIFLIDFVINIFVLHIMVKLEQSDWIDDIPI